MIAAQWSLATGLALLAWYVFAPQCLATLAVVKRETGGWTMPTALIVASISASACGDDFDWRIRSGFSFRARGSTFMICMG